MANEQLEGQLNGLRRAAVQHIEDILRNPQLRAYQRQAWERMAWNVQHVGIRVLPAREALAEGPGYAIKGESVVEPVLVMQGMAKKILPFRHIDLPESNLVREGKLRFEGVTTLFHEWAHDPLRFSEVKNPRSREFMEEELADALAINLGIKMKFPWQALHEHLEGRLPFIGPRPYGRYLRMVEAYAGRRLREAPRPMPRPRPGQGLRLLPGRRRGARPALPALGKQRRRAA